MVFKKKEKEESPEEIKKQIGELQGKLDSKFPKPTPPTETKEEGTWVARDVPAELRPAIVNLETEEMMVLGRKDTELVKTLAKILEKLERIEKAIG